MITITRSRTIEYIISVAAEASIPERNAARELASHLRRITGVRFSIMTPAAAGRHPVIAVGAGAALAHGLPGRALRGLGDEGLVVRTLGPHLILTGAPGAPRGTFYAVYTFLEDVLGCRWWAPASAFVPKRTTLTIPRLALRKIPVFEYREVLYRQRWETRWSVRNKTNGLWEAPPFGIQANWGGHHEYAGFVHTLVGHGGMIDETEFGAVVSMV